MLFRIPNAPMALTNGSVIAVRCPGCKQNGTFEPIKDPRSNQLLQDLQIDQTQGNPHFILGQRCCPNPSCRTHLFFIQEADRLAVSYPVERIDFDATGIPTPITQALEEAITCHANQCFVAAAITVRKSLEELCAANNATGPNLKERIKALGSKVVLPPDLLSGLDDLRLLGNDAAHIESQVYSKVDQEEVDVAIEFTKEVLKAVYQYSALLDRLRALKKP